MEVLATVVEIEDRVPGRFGPGRWRWGAPVRRSRVVTTVQRAGRHVDVVSGPRDEPGPPFVSAPDAGPFEARIRCLGSAEWVRSVRWSRSDGRPSSPEHSCLMRLSIDRTPVPLAWPVSLTVTSMDETVAAIEALQRVGPVASSAPATEPVLLIGQAAAAVRSRLSDAGAAAPSLEGGAAADGLLFSSLEPVTDDQGDGLVAFRGFPAVLEAGRPIGYMDAEWLLVGDPGAEDHGLVTSHRLSGPWWSTHSASCAAGLTSAPL